MHDEVGFPHYLVDKKKFKKRFKKYDHVSADRKKARGLSLLSKFL